MFSFVFNHADSLANFFPFEATDTIQLIHQMVPDSLYVGYKVSIRYSAYGFVLHVTHLEQSKNKAKNFD
jgi:hypothetical protein